MNKYKSYVDPSLFCKQFRSQRMYTSREHQRKIHWFITRGNFELSHSNVRILIVTSYGSVRDKNNIRSWKKVNYFRSEIWKFSL